MNPLGAIIFVVLSVAILVRVAGLASRKSAWLDIALFLSVVALTISFVELGAALRFWHLRLEVLLSRHRLVNNPMAPITCIAFVLLSVSILASATNTRLGIASSQGFAIGANLIGLFSVVYNLYGVQASIQLAEFVPMSTNSAVLFFLLGLAVLLSQPHRGLTRLVLSDTPSGVLSRRLLPACLLVPISLELALLHLQTSGYLEEYTGVALFTLAYVCIFGVLVVFTARAVRRADRARRAAERTAHAMTKRLNALMDNTPIVTVIKDMQGKYVYVNPQYEKVLGRRKETIIGRRLSDIATEDVWRPLEEHDRLVKEAGKPLVFEEKFSLPDGDRVYVATKFLIPDTTGSEQMLCAVSVDITERKAAEERIRALNAELESKAAELESKNKELESFSYAVSHDLRAPLRAIDGFSRALVDDYGEALDADGKRYLSRVRAGAQMMGQLIDDLLLLSRVTRSEMRPRNSDLSAIAQGVADELIDEGKDRNVEFVITPGLKAYVDPNLFRNALYNLFSNAWKFTRKLPQARIEFGTQGENGTTVYFVRDNGVGFEMEYAHKLFTPFQRLHSTEEFEGTGIGLATVQRVVERHGGKIWAKGAVGDGATFSFTLTLK